MKKIFNKKGFSIIEVVIAMAVIAIITITTISVIQIGKTKSNEALYYSESRSICNNAYEAFKYSNDFESYDDLMDNIHCYYTSCQEVVADKNYTVTYVSDMYTLTINLYWDDSDNHDTFNAKCINSDGETIYETTYSKIHEGASL